MLLLTKATSICSVVLAIVTDLFALQLRGRVMGFVQTAFAASQVLGIPAGLLASAPTPR